MRKRKGDEEKICAGHLARLPLDRRGAGLAAMLKEIREKLPHLRLLPGGSTKYLRALAPFGAPPLAGILTRPRFAGGAHTTDVNVNALRRIRPPHTATHFLQTEAQDGGEPVLCPYPK